MIVATLMPSAMIYITKIHLACIFIGNFFTYVHVYFYMYSDIDIHTEKKKSNQGQSSSHLWYVII